MMGPGAADRYRSDKLPDEFSFIREYFETLLWLANYENPETGELTGDPQTDVGLGLADLDNRSRKEIENDCSSFLLEARDLLMAARKKYGYDPIEQGAHDFALTRNRHGAGFWDRGIGEIGRELSDIAYSYGEQGITVTDNGIFLY